MSAKLWARPKLKRHSRHVEKTGTTLHAPVTPSHHEQHQALNEPKAGYVLELRFWNNGFGHEGSVCSAPVAQFCSGELKGTATEVWHRPPS